MGLGPRMKSSHDQKGKGGPKDFQPNPVEPNLFKRRPRRNVSSDTSNTGPMCAPSTVKNYPKQMWVVGWASQSRKKEENVRRPGGKIWKRKKDIERERKAIVFYQNQRCTHTSPRIEYPVDIKEIFLRSNCCMAYN